MQVMDETTGLLAFAGGVDDDAHAFEDGEGTDDVLQEFALGGSLDIAGDAARATERHEDDVAAREGEGGRRAWAFRPDLVLDHLNDDAAPESAGKSWGLSLAR